MQSGQIFKWRGAWHLKYYFDDVKDGQPLRRRTTVRLAPINDNYRSEKSVRPLAEAILSPQNSGSVSDPDSLMTFAEFTEKRFLPYILQKKKPSTHKYYKEAFQNHLKQKVGHIKMRQFTTRAAQELLDALDPKLSHASMLRIKTALSAVFTYAKQRDVILNANPVQGTRVEGRRTKPELYAYTLEEIQHMLKVLPEPARTAVAVAAFTGLREGEIRGLQWEDYDGETLNVRRSIWRTHVGATKNVESEGRVPVIPILNSMLAEHLDRKQGRVGKFNYIFAGDKKGFSLHLDNLSRRVIRPALTPCEVCGKLGNTHENESHKYKPDDRKTMWHGWHSFRRGLGTNLSELGVDDKVTQTILRHGSVETTRKHYIVINAKRATNAMKDFAEEISRRAAVGAPG